MAPLFAYLADPRHRPEWQSSLRRVELLSTKVTGVGTRWRDHTWAGMAPEMRVITHEPQQAWAEEGSWRGLRAFLLMVFVDQGDETDLEISVRMRGTGIWRLPAAGCRDADSRRAARRPRTRRPDPHPAGDLTPAP
ncbi:hypothetical protein [Nocardioides sp.]|uniref:hypothetical protein n=1 Tax=Nocardioides sp. TaxID=35761 RepID=UPI003527EC92